MKTLIGITSVVAAVIVTASSDAAVVVDQNQPDFGIGGLSTYYGGAPYYSPVTQSFTAGYNNIAGVGAYFLSGLGSVAYDVVLSTDLPQSTGNQVLFRSTITSGTGWGDVFWAPVALTKGETYYLSFTSNDNAAVASNFNDPYSRGRAYFPILPENSAAGQLSSADLVFRTYAENTFGAVPEPSAWAMMVGGFGAVGFAMRSRRKVAVTFA